VAIDAEFVAVSQEQTRAGPRGKVVVVKPARLALARVSCIRGDGPNAGVPFIDSHASAHSDSAHSRRCQSPFGDVLLIALGHTSGRYVQQAEPVVDYLTRFSGLQQGDLDPSISRHHIESMKARRRARVHTFLIWQVSLSARTCPHFPASASFTEDGGRFRRPPTSSCANSRTPASALSATGSRRTLR
jgi:hypothetical protein